jgi:aflatoxin B1 aldehyde reductase
MPLVTPQTKSRIILGLMTFGRDSKAGARITSLDEFNKCLDHLQGAGYNEVDTARSYIGGQQEAFTAEARWKERGLMLATKLYPSKPGHHKPENVRKQLEKSLKELKTESVDIFYLHAADRSLPFSETLEACNELHKEGKFVQLGLSNFTGMLTLDVYPY